MEGKSLLVGALLVLIVLIIFVFLKWRCADDTDCSSCGYCWSVPGSGGKLGACLPQNPGVTAENLKGGTCSSDGSCGVYPGDGKSSPSGCESGQICTSAHATSAAQKGADTGELKRPTQWTSVLAPPRG